MVHRPQHWRHSATCPNHLFAHSRVLLRNTVQLQHSRAEKTEIVHQHPIVRPVGNRLEHVLPPSRQQPALADYRNSTTVATRRHLQQLRLRKSSTPYGRLPDQNATFPRTDRKGKERRPSSSGRERRVLLFHLWITGQKD